MSKRKSGVTRREFTEKVNQSESGMKDKESDLKVYTSDLEQEHQTGESLELQGADEDSGEISGSIERAKDITADRFNDHNEQLEGLQKENESLESDFQSRKESSESDVEKLQKAKLDSSEAISAMVQAKEAALRGKEFLQEQMDQTRSAREVSEQAQRELENKIKALRGSGKK